MSGYHNSLRFDDCNKVSDMYQSDSQNDYTLNVAANYHTSADRPFPLSQGGQPDFWGPLRGIKVTQESFLQGRGQTLADCPDCDVRWLPESVFPTATQHSAPRSCQRTDLQPLFTRVPKVCNGLDETDISAYWMMPSAYQVGYAGYKAVVDTQLQTRQADPDASVKNGGETYGCRKTYGTYGSGRDFSRYAS